MAVARTSISHDLYICPLCQNLLKDPVTIPCGRSYCKECIIHFWDTKEQRSCPQCGDTFILRHVLCKNNRLAKKVEELKKIQLQPAHFYARPGDVECDSCIGRKHKAVKSCLVCLASFCKDHLKPHDQSPAFKKHKLVEACAELQEKICSEHDKLLEIYCRTDKSLICHLCTMDQHRGHDTVSAETERTKKQNELKEDQKKVQEQKQTVESKKSFLSLCVSPGCDDSPSFTVNQHLSFDGTKKSLSDLKKGVKQICEKKLNKIQPQAFDLHHHTESHNIHDTEIETGQMILPSEAKSRDFLQYFCYLTLDPNTVHHRLILSEKNRVVTWSGTDQRYSHNPERFDSKTQVLCKESVCGRCYWEVEWRGSVSISVSNKEISRKGNANQCLFGYNNQSWSLGCSSSSVSFWHNNIKTELRGPSSSRIGVYVDHSAGTLSFYSVSDTMRLLHRVHTTFTQPLYAGFRLWYNSTVKLCDSK